MTKLKMRNSYKTIWNSQFTFWIEQGLTQEEAVKKADEKIQKVHRLSKKVSRN